MLAPFERADEIRVRFWPLTAAVVGDCRGRFWGVKQPPPWLDRATAIDPQRHATPVRTCYIRLVVLSLGATNETARISRASLLWCGCKLASRRARRGRPPAHRRAQHFVGGKRREQPRRLPRWPAAARLRGRSNPGHRLPLR